MVLNYKRNVAGKSFWKAYHRQMRSYSGSPVPGSRQPHGEDSGRTEEGGRDSSTPTPAPQPHLPWQRPPTPGAHSLPDPRLFLKQVPKAAALLVGNRTSPAGGTDGGLTVSPAGSLSEGGEDALIPHTHTCMHTHTHV